MSRVESGPRDLVGEAGAGFVGRPAGGLELGDAALEVQ